MKSSPPRSKSSSAKSGTTERSRSARTAGSPPGKSKPDSTTKQKRALVERKRQVIRKSRRLPVLQNSAPAQLAADDERYKSWLREVMALGVELEGKDHEYWANAFALGDTPQAAAMEYKAKLHAKANQQQLQQLVKVEAGKTYAPAELGLTAAQVEAALSTSLTPHEGDGGLIGPPLHLDGHTYAIVRGHVNNAAYTFEVLPVRRHNAADLAGVPIKANSKLPETWSERRERFPKHAPEEIPLGDLLVTDPAGRQWIIVGVGGFTIQVDPEEGRQAFLQNRNLEDRSPQALKIAALREALQKIDDGLANLPDEQPIPISLAGAIAGIRQIAQEAIGRPLYEELLDGLREAQTTGGAQ